MVILITFLAIILISKATDSPFSLVTKDDFENSFSQYHEINLKDEYIVAEEVNWVTFNKIEYKKLFGDFPIGDSEATLSLKAHYNYYIKLSEVTHDLDNRTLTINIPKLYLLTPVAFDSASLKEKGVSKYFGGDPDELLNSLRRGITSELNIKGKVQMRNVREKASRSIAENFNAFLSNNKVSAFYDEIAVVFNDDKKVTYPKYGFKNSFCNPGPCRFEFDIGKDMSFVFE